MSPQGIEIPRFNSVELDPSLVNSWPDSRDRFAVAMLFARTNPNSAQSTLVLTKRADHLKSHSGQIGMPGGRVESGDLSPVATAKRETHEELGIPQDEIECLGYLQATQTLSGGILIPTVCTTTLTVDQLRPNRDEVAAIIALDWNRLTRAHAEFFQFNYFGNWRSSHVFRHENHKIWGLTAAIIFAADLRSPHGRFDI